MEAKLKYCCTYCTYSTSRKGDINKHERIHTGQRPFACADCGYSFTQSSHLKMHMLRKHSKEARPFKCSSCTACFKSFSHLSRHRKALHHVKSKPGPGKHICFNLSNGSKDTAREVLTFDLLDVERLFDTNLLLFDELPCLQSSEWGNEDQLSLFMAT